MFLFFAGSGLFIYEYIEIDIFFYFVHTTLKQPMSSCLQLLIYLLLIVITESQTFCNDNNNNDNGWCSNDSYSSRNTYLSYLTSICIGTCLLLWFEKKLIFLLILWYLTLLLFIYFNHSIIILFIFIMFDFMFYFILFPLTHSNHLDVFGDIIINKLLDEIIYNRLIMKRDEKLIKDMKNKKKLLKESKRNKTKIFKQNIWRGLNKIFVDR